jgi:peptidyl-prolyl cis-trans isomerase SurA
MKKFVVLSALLTLTVAVKCQVLFTYGKHSVSANEFLNAYNKNKVASADNRQAMLDYLDLYIKFKLKVQAATDWHLDTLPALQADLQNFRNQIEPNYLKDDRAVNELVQEAFARSRKDIHVMHYFVPSTPDSAKNYQAALELYHELQSGGKKANELIANLNQKGIGVKQNDLGYVTVFVLPYEYENIIYKLNTSEVSSPYQTSKGWHIFKNLSERPAVGKITVAQILFAFPGESDAEKAKAKALAETVYNNLNAGADFSQMAATYSDDRATFLQGGVLPEFGVTKYDPAFEAAAFALKKDGEISQPFETAFGYHILKRLHASRIPEVATDSALYVLKQQVLSDSRMEKARKKFIAEILPKTGFKKFTVNQFDLWRITDSAMLASRNITAGTINEKTPLFSFNNGKKITVDNWLLFVRNKTVSASAPDYQSLFKDFTDASIINNYRDRLEEFNSAFRSQMQEFKEGNLLFEIMQLKVWSKAASDSAGLLSFYQANKGRYLWKASAEAVLFSCSDKRVAEKAQESLKKGAIWRQVLAQDSENIQADSGRYELSQIPVAHNAALSAGTITTAEVNPSDSLALFVQIIKLYPDGVLRTFEEAHGLLINDYQDVLEQQWLDKLRKQYPVKVNQKTLDSLLR